MCKSLGSPPPSSSSISSQSQSSLAWFTSLSWSNPLTLFLLYCSFCRVSLLGVDSRFCGFGTPSLHSLFFFLSEDTIREHQARSRALARTLLDDSMLTKKSLDSGYLSLMKLSNKCTQGGRGACFIAMVCIGANYISSCDWRKFEVKRKEGNYCLEDSSSTFWYNSEPWPVMIIVNGLASSSHHRLRRTKEKRQADGPTDWTPHCCCRMAFDLTKHIPCHYSTVVWTIFTLQCFLVSLIICRNFVLSGRF